MEGGDMLEEEVPVGLPAGPVAGELDRSALASHCAAVSYHMAAMARLFDPSAKAAAEPKKHRKVAEEGDVPRPKRELSQYNLCVLRRASAARAALRAAGVALRAARALRACACAVRLRAGRCSFE
jgi:hypothetical protein